VRRALVIAVALSCAAAPAAAQAAQVDLLVVGKGGGVLRAAKPVTLKRETGRVGHRRCTVAATTPLAALARTSLPLKLRDYGSCGRRPSDATGLYLRGIGKQVERGADGWVFKIGRRTPSTGAGDPASRLRDGARLTWFWCRNGANGCQRTLEVRPDSTTVAAGSQLRVTVRGYDDRGRGVPVAGATVALAGAAAVTDPRGRATLAAPATPGRAALTARRAGLVPSFPEEVVVA
jgi:hypothetical protein